MMRGTDEASGSLFSYVDLEARIPARHPLRKIRQVVNEALASLDAEFEALYTDFGRPSIPPERLIRASLLQILFSVRSERQLMEQMQYNLLFRWFVGLSIDDPVWVPTVFTKNRDRLLSTEMSRKVMAAILAHREVAPLLSDDHFSVDGTLVKAWASMKSFQPKASDSPPDDDPGSPPASAATAEDQTEPTEAETAPMPRPSRKNRPSRNAEVDFRGEKRSNATHASTTDPDARLYKKSPGTGAMLCFIGHALMENRSGLIVQGDLTQADGHAERRAALDMIHRHSPGSTRRLTLGADKGFDVAEFVADLRQACVTPHVAQKSRYSAIDGRTTRHDGYAMSQRNRNRADLAMNEGNALRSLGRLEEALAAYARARDMHALPHLSARSELNIDRAILATNEGVTLASLGRFEEALSAYHKASRHWSGQRDLPLPEQKNFALCLALMSALLDEMAAEDPAAARVWAGNGGAKLGHGGGGIVSLRAE